MKFSARTSWAGSTGVGWEDYDRTHAARVSEQTVTLTTAEEKGDPRLANPELLVLAAASSCQMLWFLHLAAKARIDVVAYEDQCEAEMPGDRFTRHQGRVCMSNSFAFGGSNASLVMGDAR